jgi:hypothetical protein
VEVLWLPTGIHQTAQVLVGSLNPAQEINIIVKKQPAEHHSVQMDIPRKSSQMQRINAKECLQMLPRQNVG